jgi:hypothetical protein
LCGYQLFTLKDEKLGDGDMFNTRFHGFHGDYIKDSTKVIG